MNTAPDTTLYRYNGSRDGWETWSPRVDIAPRFDLDRSAAGGRAALRIDGSGNAAEYGAWRRRVAGIGAGKSYRFAARYRVKDVPADRQHVAARLEWLDANGQRLRGPDFVLDSPDSGGWKRVEYAGEAPTGARSVLISLALQWSPGGTVWWDGIELTEAAPMPDRTVRVASVFLRPRGTKSAAESVALFCRQADEAAKRKPDLIVMPEGITVVGTDKTYADVAETVPGPTTEALGACAKRHRCYIVAGLYERVGKVIYNTAVLIDRTGRLVGEYRKTHLPYEEVEAGITPGDRYPVFDTDFGKLGILICWDVQFPEPARALALRGAEILCLPIWGGSETLARARAIENHVFLISSSYDMKTLIVDPAGAVLGEATAESPFAVADLHPDRRILQPWIGDMKARTWKERRPDIRVEP